MKAHVEEFPLRAMAEVLEVSRSGYYAGISEGGGAMAEENGRLTEAIRRIHQGSRGVYGSPRICDALHLEGWRCGENRVARLMREDGIEGTWPRRKRVVTTQSDHAHKASPNLIKGIEAERPDQIWVMDITYIRIGMPGEHQWVYLAAVLDMFSRKIVGWQIGATLEATLVIKALENALSTRDWQPGLICHSDRGIQYACGDFRALLGRHGILQSMSAKGNCYDNAMMESFFGTLKTEEVDFDAACCYADIDEARRAIFDYIETFYNRNRLHTSLKGLLAGADPGAPCSSSDKRPLACSPCQLEEAYSKQQHDAQQLVSSQNGAQDVEAQVVEFSKASDVILVEADQAQAGGDNQTGSQTETAAPNCGNSGPVEKARKGNRRVPNPPPAASTVSRIIPSIPQKVALQQSLLPFPRNKPSKSDKNGLRK